MVAPGDLVTSKRVINSMGQPSKLQGIVLRQAFEHREPSYDRWFVVQFFNGERASLPETVLNVVSCYGDNDGDKENL